MFELILICDEEKIFEGNVLEVNVVTPKGPVTILPKHTPYMSQITEIIHYTPQNEKKSSVTLKDGFIYTNGELCFAVIDKD